MAASPSLSPGSCADEVRRHVDRISSTPAFANSERMASFLRFAVEQVLAGKAHELKEYVIGVEVFRRTAGYDTRLDPVVRVEARRLRSKLAAYYAAEGKDDEIIIELPKGSYVPVFRRSGDAKAEQVATTPGIAVLPFKNITGEEDDNYFCDGLAQELIHLLTHIDGIRVLAWHSTMRMKEVPDPRTFGRDYNVTTMLTGAVRRTADRVRISVQLIDTATGFYIWSDSYDRELGAIFDIQEEIANAIVRAFHRKLLLRDDARPKVKCMDAYQLYLKGRVHWSERTDVGLHRGIEFFEKALVGDPEYAVAYSGLADSYSVLAEYGLADPRIALPKARDAALKALAIDPDLSEAETSLGLITGFYDWNWEQSEQHFRRAIRLNPNNVTAHHWFGLDLNGTLGRMDLADHHVKIALELDPYAPLLVEAVGYLHLLREDYPAAIREYSKLCERDPYYYKGFTATGRALIQMGKYREAIEALEKGRSLAGDIPSIVGALCQASAELGDFESAEQLLARLCEISQQRYVPYTTFAIANIGFKRYDRALHYLEKSLERHDLPLISIKMHPAYKPLRQEPRFQAILRTMNMA